MTAAALRFFGTLRFTSGRRVLAFSFGGVWSRG
jgi:hypothetical protein